MDKKTVSYLISSVYKGINSHLPQGTIIVNNILKNKTLSLLSFEPNGLKSDYQLYKLDVEMVDKLVVTVENLERRPQVYLCARGDCFKTQQLHEEFFQRNLSKLFVVGQKAKYYSQNFSEEKNRFYEASNSKFAYILRER